MKKETIFGIEYEVINDPTGIISGGNILLRAKNTIIVESINCKNIICESSMIVKGDQIVEGYQIVKGYQRVEGYQIVKGYQIVEGYQIVKGYQRVEGDQIVKGYQIVKGDQIVEGYQIVKGDQIVEGYQIVKGDQRVKGDQVVEGYQRVEGIVISSYCKWEISIYKETIKIGCKEKPVNEWIEFFNENKTYETDANSIDYLKIKSAFQIALGYHAHLILMNKNADKIKDIE